MEPPPGAARTRPLPPIQVPTTTPQATATSWETPTDDHEHPVLSPPGWLSPAQPPDVHRRRRRFGRLAQLRCPHPRTGRLAVQLRAVGTTRRAPAAGGRTPDDPQPADFPIAPGTMDR